MLRRSSTACSISRVSFSNSCRASCSIFAPAKCHPSTVIARDSAPIRYAEGHRKSREAPGAARTADGAPRRKGSTGFEDTGTLRFTRPAAAARSPGTSEASIAAATPPAHGGIPERGARETLLPGHLDLAALEEAVEAELDDVEAGLPRAFGIRRQLGHVARVVLDDERGLRVGHELPDAVEGCERLGAVDVEARHA